MKRLTTILLAVASLSLLNTGFGAQTTPNILFVFIDDIGWGDLSCYGSGVTNKMGQPITPNLDRIASRGIRFTQGYVASPICSPSRTGVLTGMEPARYAIYSFLNDRANNAARNMANWVQPDTVTAPRTFRAAGYTTGQFGKWHMGNGRDVNDAPPPSEYGFDQSLVAFEGNGDRLLYYNDDGSKYSLSQQNEDATVGTYQYLHFYEAAPRQTSEALKFITNAVNAGKPFYVHVPYNDTHSPYNVPPGQEHDFDHITSDATAQKYLGELRNLDAQIGRLADGLDGLGVGSNTIMVIVGDNGAPNDSLNTLLKRNGGLRGGKGNIYEGGIREPFIVRCPGLVAEGLVNTNTVISTFDLFLTYASICGLSLPGAPFMGEDMSDVFRGSTRKRTRPLFWEYGTVSGLSPASPKLAIRSGDYKFMRNPDGSGRALYIIPSDNTESSNQISNPAYASTIASLEMQLTNWYEVHVLGNVGETYPCGSTSTFTGTVIADSYDVTDGYSPDSGFGPNSGANFELADRLAGDAASLIAGYRLGPTGGTDPRQASDFSIANDHLTAAPRDGNGRFELSPDLISGFDFGSYLAGHNYELSIQMSVEAPEASTQRMSLSIADLSDLAVGNVNIGVQIGSDGAGGLAVFKRVSAGANSSGAALNIKLISGLPIGTPVNLKVKISDYNANTTDFASTYEIYVNNTMVNSGNFRFNTSTTARHLTFDVAAHDVPVWYDNLQLVVTSGGGSITMCRKPILSFSEVAETPSGTTARLYWSAQPGLTVAPEYSPDLSHWYSITNGSQPVSVTTDHGSFQWLNILVPSAGEAAYFRLRRD